MPSGRRQRYTVALSADEPLHVMDASEAKQDSSRKKFVSTAALRLTASDRCQTDIAQLPSARSWASSMSYNKKTNHAAQALFDRAPVVLALVDQRRSGTSPYRRFSMPFPLSEKSSVWRVTTRVSALSATWGNHEGLDAS